MAEFTKLRLSEEGTKMVKTLQTRTGITPNIMCRFALCYAINKEKISEFVQVDDNGMEINSHTLFGELSSMYEALIREKCIELKLDPEKDFFKLLKNYTHSGITSLYARVKGLEDFENLLIENE